jgi:hypothetical protein
VYLPEGAELQSGENALPGWDRSELSLT